MKFLFNYALLDVATPWPSGSQDPATPIITSFLVTVGLLALSGFLFIMGINYLKLFLVILGIFVFWLLYKAWVLYGQNNMFFLAWDGSLWSKKSKCPPK